MSPLRGRAPQRLTLVSHAGKAATPDAPLLTTPRRDIMNSLGFFANETTEHLPLRENGCSWLPFKALAACVYLSIALPRMEQVFSFCNQPPHVSSSGGLVVPQNEQWALAFRSPTSPCGRLGRYLGGPLRSCGYRW